MSDARRCKSCGSIIKYVRNKIPPKDRVTLIKMEEEKTGVALHEGGYLCVACVAEKAFGIYLGDCDHPYAPVGTGTVYRQRVKRIG